MIADILLGRMRKLREGNSFHKKVHLLKGADGSFPLAIIQKFRSFNNYDCRCTFQPYPKIH